MQELKRLNGLGIRSVRFNLVQSGAATIDMLEPLSKRVNDLGWHVQIHMLADQIAQTEDVLRRLPSSIVFDHLARIPTRLPDCRKKADAKPDDAVLFDALADWAPDEKTRNLILSYKNRVMLES